MTIDAARRFSQYRCQTTVDTKTKRRLAMLSAGRPVLSPFRKYLWALYFAVCLGWGIHDWGEILASPTMPNTTTGNIVPYNNHGKIIYITRSQSRAMIWEPCIGPILVLIVFLIRQRQTRHRT